MLSPHPTLCSNLITAIHIFFPICCKNSSCPPKPRTRPKLRLSPLECRENLPSLQKYKEFLKCLVNPFPVAISDTQNFFLSQSQASKPCLISYSRALVDLGMLELWGRETNQETRGDEEGKENHRGTNTGGR